MNEAKSRKERAIYFFYSASHKHRKIIKREKKPLKETRKQSDDEDQNSPFLRALTREETATQTLLTGKIILFQSSMNLSFTLAFLSTFFFFLLLLLLLLLLLYLFALPIILTPASAATAATATAALFAQKGFKERSNGEMILIFRLIFFFIGKFLFFEFVALEKLLLYCCCLRLCCSCLCVSVITRYQKPATDTCLLTAFFFYFLN